MTTLEATRRTSGAARPRRSSRYVDRDRRAPYRPVPPRDRGRVGSWATRSSRTRTPCRARSSRTQRAPHVVQPHPRLHPGGTASTTGSSTASSAIGSTFINDHIIGKPPGLALHAVGRPGRCPRSAGSGVVAIFTWAGYAVAGLRSAGLVLVGTLLFGFFGYWQSGVDTVIITILAVLISILVGIPVGIAMARRPWVSAVLTPVLDVMQTMPSLAYIPIAGSCSSGSAPPAPWSSPSSTPSPRWCGSPSTASRRCPTPRSRRRGSLGADPEPAAPQGAAADGPAHDHRRRQPVHAGRALDGRDRRA